MSVRVAQSWFKRFQSGNFDAKHAPLSGRSIIAKVDEIIKNIEQDLDIKSRNIAKEFNIDHKTVLNHLKEAEYKKTIFETVQCGG